MTTLFIILMVIILGMAIAAMVFVAMNDRDHDASGTQDYDPDAEYYDEDGDHVYYDRSRIEKKQFKKAHPEVKDVRTFRRLFRWPK